MVRLTANVLAVLVVVQTAVVAGVTRTTGAAQEPPRADGWVVLPVDEYRALRARAFPETPDAPPPPVDATLTRVDYDLRVAGESVVGQARLTIDGHQQGWASVQVPPGLLVRDARIDGRPTALVDGNPPRGLLSRTGRSLLTLDVGLPLTTQSGNETIALPSSGSALSSVTLVVPRTGVDLTVSGGLIGEQSEAGGESRWVVHGA